MIDIFESATLLKLETKRGFNFEPHSKPTTMHNTLPQNYMYILGQHFQIKQVVL